MPPNNSIRLPQSQSSPLDWEGANPLQPNFVWPRPSLWPTSPLFTPWGAGPALPGKPRCQFGGKTSRRQRLLTTCGSVVGRSPCQALSSTLPCYIDLCCFAMIWELYETWRIWEDGCLVFSEFSLLVLRTFTWKGDGRKDIADFYIISRHKGGQVDKKNK